MCFMVVLNVFLNDEGDSISLNAKRDKKSLNKAMN